MMYRFFCEEVLGLNLETCPGIPSRSGVHVYTRLQSNALRQACKLTDACQRTQPALHNSLRNECHGPEVCPGTKYAARFIFFFLFFTLASSIYGFVVPVFYSACTFRPDHPSFCVPRPQRLFCLKQVLIAVFQKCLSIMCRPAAVELARGLSV
jgi:hypothetical protein